MFRTLRRVHSRDRLRGRSSSSERSVKRVKEGPLTRTLASGEELQPSPSPPPKLSRLHMHVFAMVSVVVVPIQLFLQLFSLDYYERQGAFLPIVAFFIMLTRGIDVVFSPLMQTLTDITRTKWGRRKPFLVVGCIPCAVSLMMLLFPPFTIVTDFSSSPISLWFGSTFLVFNVLQHVIVTPYEAMAPEVTSDRGERRSIFVLTILYDGLGSLLTTSLPLILASGLEWLPNGKCSSRDTAASCDVLNTRIRFSFIGLFFAVLIVQTNFLCAHLVREDRSHVKREHKRDASAGASLGSAAPEGGLVNTLSGLAVFEVKTANGTSDAARRMDRLAEEESEGLEGQATEMKQDRDEKEKVVLAANNATPAAATAAMKKSSITRVKSLEDLDEEILSSMRRDDISGIHGGMTNTDSDGGDDDDDDDDGDDNDDEGRGGKVYSEAAQRDTARWRRRRRSRRRRRRGGRRGRRRKNIDQLDPESLIPEESAQRDGAYNVLTVPLVPAVLSMLRNRAFTALLPAWVCDSMAGAMTTTMLVFYVRYIIQPEQQTLAESGIECRAFYVGWSQASSPSSLSSPYESIPWRCKSSSVLSAMACSMLVGSFLGTPLWSAISSRVETRNAWLLWSAAVGLSHMILGFADQGDVTLAVLLALVVGMPYGAGQTLNDAIVADVLDYDEFLTGMRNEAFFAISKSFLPRLASAPAAAIPIALLGSLDHRPPVEGSILEQSPEIRDFCRAGTIWVPAALSLVSLVLKTRYPLRTKEQVRMVRDGVKLNRMHATHWARRAAAEAKYFKKSDFDHVILNDQEATKATCNSAPTQESLFTQQQHSLSFVSSSSTQSPPVILAAGNSSLSLPRSGTAESGALASVSLTSVSTLSSTGSPVEDGTGSHSQTLYQSPPQQQYVSDSSDGGDAQGRPLHMTGRGGETQHHRPIRMATDPITRKPYRPLLTGLTPSEQCLLFSLLTFPQAEVLRELKAKGPGPLVRRMAAYSLATGFLSLALLWSSLWSLRFLRVEETYRGRTIWPTLSAMAFGHSLLLSLYAYMRHQTAKNLMQSDDISFRLLDIAIAQMELQDTIKTAKIRYKVRLEPRNVHSMDDGMRKSKFQGHHKKSKRRGKSNNEEISPAIERKRAWRRIRRRRRQREREERQKAKQKRKRNEEQEQHLHQLHDRINENLSSDVMNKTSGAAVAAVSVASADFKLTQNSLAKEGGEKTLAEGSDDVLLFGEVEPNEHQELLGELSSEDVLRDTVGTFVSSESDGESDIESNSNFTSSDAQDDEAGTTSAGGMLSGESDSGQNSSSAHAADYGYAPRFIRDNLCYQCSLNPPWYLAAAWRLAQLVALGVLSCGVYLCLYYHSSTKHGHNVVPVVSYITLWNGFLAVGFCFWPSHHIHKLDVARSKIPQEVGFMMGAMFVFSNLAILLSKLLHSTADSPSKSIEWEDKTPLNVAAVASFLLGACLLSVVLILFVFLSDFMAVDDGVLNDKKEDNTIDMLSNREESLRRNRKKTDDEIREISGNKEDCESDSEEQTAFYGRIEEVIHTDLGDEKIEKREGSASDEVQNEDEAMQQWWQEWRKRRMKKREHGIRGPETAKEDNIDRKAPKGGTKKKRPQEEANSDGDYCTSNGIQSDNWKMWVQSTANAESLG